MMNQQEAIRDARALGVPKMLILGLQHMFAMFGATILVPILVNVYFEGEGLSIQVTLICAGLGTLFFHLCSKLKVPAFLGSSFAFLGGFQTVAQLDTGIFANMTRGKASLCLRRYCGSRCFISDPGVGDQADRCKKGNEVLTSRGNRTDDYLYRSFSGTLCYFQCIL